MKFDKSPLFILGIQRSGTTLVSRMLGTSDEIALFPRETHIFPLFWNRAKYLSSLEKEALKTFLLKTFPKVNNGWTDEQAFEQLRAVLDYITTSNNDLSSAEKLLQHILSFWQSKNEGKIIGEKTPAHIYYIKQIKRTFPTAKFILMIRDPRACALSEKMKLLNNERINKSFNLLNFMVRWASSSQLISYYQKTLTRDVHVIRYEDLITDPSFQLIKLCQFLDIDFSEKMLNVGVINSSFQDKKQKDKKFNATNIDRWKEKLPKHEILKIENCLHPLMQKWNYNVAFSQKTTSHIKEKLIVRTAAKASLVNSAKFHHMNRSQKYKFF